jgi:hypothetical protein
MNETKIQAFKRMKLGKASKAELQILLKWAKQEIKEWEAFKLLCEKKIKTPTTTK